MSRNNVLSTNRPRLFSSTKVRRVIDGSNSVLKKRLIDFKDTNVASTSSFRYDPPFLGIRSTQQIPTDFSLFENHTFFNSAEVNVNVAFDRIINEYPFDGSRKESESFLDSLTGFEKWVLDQFPTNFGYLNFSGSSGVSPDEGTYIIVRDFAGTTYPSVSRLKTGDSILDPINAPFTVELQLLIPEQQNGNQIICQKMSGSSQGITLAISESLSTQTCDLIFGAVSGSRDVYVTASLQKGSFNHVVASFDRRVGSNRARIYVNEELVGESRGSAVMERIDFSFSPLTIGSGTSHDRLTAAAQFIPSETFSGSIDEFRIFHSIRDLKQQRLFATKNIYQTPELKLYFKFNEPSVSFGPDDVVLDSSGNSLHSRITNFSLSLRETGSISSPLLSERADQNPVLFPMHPKVQALNSRLLASASNYDIQNPNLITKLVPKHYFLEGQNFEALSDEDGTIGDALGGAGIPGTAEIGSAQLLSTFLYVWAKFFDEVKMMIDLLGNSIFVDYDKPNYIADQFLPFLASFYGFEIPAFFANSSIDQFIDGENIGPITSTSAESLRFVQNQLWRRILTNIGEVIRSKGTLHSIKSLFRSMGIEPDNSFRIREFGGPTVRQLEDSRDKRSAITTFINFSGSLAEVDDAEAVNSLGVHPEKPFLMTPFLSSSRAEVGFPEPRGTLVNQDIYPPHGISDDASDGLFTSGSWTYEAIYRWPSLISGSHPTTQSLARLNVTGSVADGVSGSLVANMLAISGSGIRLFVAPSTISSVPLKVALTGVNVLDGQQWNISFGRLRNDEVGSFASSSYFLRAARQSFGEIVEKYYTSSFYYEGLPDNNVLQAVSSSFNASGSFITIGSQSISVSSNQFLNDTSNDNFARFTDFTGKIGQLRIWSVGLSEDEFSEHVRNPRSLGVIDPLVNFNFVKTASGSFGRNRIDASMEQPVSISNDAGHIEVFDFSQNEFHLSGSGFQPNINVFSPERIFYSQLSSRFDEAASSNKVRVRGFQSFSNVQEYGGSISPVYEIPRNEIPNDDSRFAIDFSIMDALNEDIIKIFSTLDAFDNALGNPELIFSPDYPALDDLREVYFNRLTDKIRLKQLFEFFKWFDSILGVTQLVEQLIPKKTKFLGMNFIVESHMLERPKFEYLYNDIYLGENERNGLKGTILLQQFSALLKRY